MHWLNVAIGTTAFVLWAYLFGGPFARPEAAAYFGPYRQPIAAFAVGLFTWGVGLIPPHKVVGAISTS